jgi:hypothetical protein
MPVPEGNKRIGHVVVVFVLYATPDDPMTSKEIGVFPDLPRAKTAAKLRCHQHLEWSHYDDSEGDIWFAETIDGVMYTIHSAARARLDI